MKVLAIMEAGTLTGPAKNLVGFCRWIRSAEAVASGIDIDVEVTTYCRGSDDGDRNSFIRAARDAGVTTHIIRERRVYDPAVVPQLRALFRRVQPDIVQTHNVKSHFLMKLTGLHRTTPWFAFQHGYTATDWLMRGYNQLDRWSLRSARRVVTVCKAFVPLLESYGVARDRIRVLHNSVTPAYPVPAEERERLRSRLGIAPDAALLLTIGRLSREKGHADLLEALSIVAHRWPELRWKAVILGNGPEQASLERRVAGDDLRGRVVFPGFDSNTAPHYAAADIFVLPSHSEGSSNVLLEAMAARLPVVATDAGGTPEIIRNGESGLLVPPRSPQALADGLGRLLTNSANQRALAAEGFRRAVEDFSPERYRQSLLSIYVEPRQH